MPHAEFVHLRTHSAYSLSEGALKIPDLVALCVRERMPAVAVADTGNLFGAMEFAPAAAEAGVQPIIGCQIALGREDGSGGRGIAVLTPDPFVLLVQNRQGYQNLLKLVSKSFLETEGGEAPQIALADLEALGEGLIALTGGPAGPVGRLLGEGQGPAAEAMLSRLATLFPGRLYVELMRHGLAAESRIEPGFLDLAYKHELPLVATNEAFFADRGMYEAHDALLCIADGAYVGQEERRRVTPEHYFKSAPEMRELFSDLPEAVDNTLTVARRCAFMPEIRKPLLPVYNKLEGRTEEAVLTDKAVEGLERRLQAHVFTPDMDAPAREVAALPYRKMLDYELGIIEQMGFPGYFLIVADFVGWAREHGVPVGPGRGSGAASVVAWSLTITDLDPLRWDLVFERFMNPERVSMPDFDIDFCMDRRDEVLDYVQREYGADRVAQIITFGTLQARAVLRDVGRVLEMPYGQVDRICKMVPNTPGSQLTLKQAIESEAALRQMRDEDETVARLIEIALKLEGLHRHASTHAAGVVIGDRPLDELTPLYRDPRSTMPVTQFNMKYVELTGLVKYDFLGLRTLTVLARAVELLKASGVEVDLSNLPLDDPATYEMMCRGETTGVFQLESSGMRDVLRKLKPDRFEDIIAVVALYRPGPMDNIPSYIKRKHGEEAIDYLHPSLEDILRETYGIMIYQDQVLKIAQTLSGYTLGGADLLRRAMGKKIKAEMKAQRTNFIGGAEKKGVARGLAGRIFDQVDKFAGYGFVKSHAAAYALIAYQTAWLKTNYPVEFMAALMSIESGNTDKLGMLRAELERLDVALLPPDINRSGVAFTVEETQGGRPAVRYALAAVKNVGAAAMNAVVAERDANGPYRDLAHFAGRLEPRQVNKRQLENLAGAGAFDRLAANRRQAFDAVETVLRHASAAQHERESNQTNLFGGGDEEDSARLRLPDVADWPQQEKLQREFEALGFYLSAHPLQSVAKLCEKLGVVQWSDIAAGNVRDSRVKLAGIVGGRRLTNSSRGSRMAFVQMSDASGSYEVTMFSEVLATARDLLDAGKPLLMSVEVQRRDEDIRLTAQKVEILEEVATNVAAGLRIFIRDEGPLETLAAVFSEHGVKGRGRVSLVLEATGREVEMELAANYAISPAIRGAIKAIPGIVDVQDL